MRTAMRHVLQARRPRPGNRHRCQSTDPGRGRGDGPFVNLTIAFSCVASKSRPALIGPPALLQSARRGILPGRESHQKPGFSKKPGFSDRQKPGFSKKPGFFGLPESGWP